MESVSIKRAIASLKPARERAGISPLQIAESTGLDLDQISLLEQGDLVRTSLGTLSGYVIAMESTLGWTLPGLRESSAALQQKVTVDVEDLPERPVFNPLQMMVQGGLTVMSQRRIRGERRDRESEVFIHLAQMERTHAGI